jgi:BASS family bile acid:Na+ symporter
MLIQDVTRLLVSVTLIEMMGAIGLEVTTEDLRVFARDKSLMARAAVANYLLVPAAAIVLLWAFRTGAPVAAGFLILAACPGAPFGPPITAIAKGDVAAAAWLMALLAASSTLFAPLLLAGLLPFVAGPTRLEVDPIRMATLLAMTQLLPLCGGLLIRNRYPGWADAARKPARRLGAILSLSTVALILVTNFHALAEIRIVAYFGMLALLLASLAAGAVLAGRDDKRRKALTLTTSLRNVGLALFIASTAVADTAAATAIVAYGLMEITGSVVVAVIWGRMHYVRSNRVSQPVAAL